MRKRLILSVLTLGAVAFSADAQPVEIRPKPIADTQPAGRSHKPADKAQASPERPSPARAASLAGLHSGALRGLVLYHSFDFDEGTGKVADRSGKGNDGTISGARWTSEGKVGGAYAFDGKDDRIETKDADRLDLAAGITLAAWVKVTSSTGDEQVILGKWYAGPAEDHSYILELARSLKPQVAVRNESGMAMCTSPAALALDRWHYVVGTYDGKTLKIHVNGVEKNSRRSAGSIRKSKSPLVIGAHDSAGDRNPFRGSIDEIGIWNRALTAEEVQAVRTWGLPADNPIVEGLAALWTGDSHARDSVGRNHGKLKGGAAFASGKIGKCFKFDGRDDYVDFGNPKALQITGSQTIAMWIRPDRLDVRQSILHKASGGEGAIHLDVDPTGELTYRYGSSGSERQPYCSYTTFGDARHRGIGARKLRVYKVTRTELEARTWTHIAVVRDLKAMRLRWYVDGALVVEAETTIRQAKASNVPLVIGKGDLKNFGGLIDEVAIWSRALRPEEVRAVFEAEGLGGLWLVAVPPHVMRVALADRVELDDGKVLLGTIQIARYTVTSSVGTFEFAADRVAAMAPVGKAASGMWVMLTDGQVLRGSLAEKAFALQLTTGSTLRVPLARLRQLGYRISKDKPAASRPSGPMVTLRSGDRLRWANPDLKLALDTLHGRVALSAKSFLSVESSGLGHRVRFANGSVLSGVLTAKTLKLKLQLAPEALIGRRDIVRLTCPRKPVIPAEAATVTLRNGDRLVGQVADKVLTIRTELGQAAVPPACVLTMKFDPSGAVTARTWDGTVLTGKLTEAAVTFTIDPGGPTLKLRLERIVSIARPFALPPPDMVTKIEKLIALLGASSFGDREQAQRQLIRTGAPAKPILERYLKDSDPEVRIRVRAILEKIDPPKPPASEPVEVKVLNGLGRIIQLK